MEWREQSAVGSDEAYLEARRWIEAATEKAFGSEDFRAALENGVLLCDLINRIKPGTIRRVNRLPTPIAGLDNLNVFLKAGRKLGLKEAQLFHPGDLQDLSSRVTVKHQETNRRLKNVLITIFWLGRRAQCERGYDGPHLNLKAFEGLLGTALFKALQESSSQKGGSVRDSGFGDSWYSEREEVVQLRGGGRGGHRRDDSLDSLDSLGSRPRSISSDATLKGGSEGCCSDAEADAVLRMDDNRSGLSYRRSVTITPKASGPFNQFLPTKDKVSGYVPAPLRKKRAERHEDSRRSWVGPASGEDEGTLSRSKSTSDILVERQDRYEELQRFREQTKETEDKWQDDLSKWKNRRRSVNSDIVKKKEERDHIEQITSGGGRRSKTFKEMQEERETKGRNSIGGRLGSLSYLDDEDVFNAPVVAPRTRTLPARSYTIDTPYSSSEPPEPVLKEADPPSAAASPAPPPAPRGSDTVNRPAGRDATTAIGLRSAAPAPPQRSPERTVKTEASSTATSLEKEPRPRLPLSRTQPEAEAPSSGFLHKQPPPPPQLQTGSMEARPPGVSRVSASLPRSYQRSDSARLTSVVAPRPFGAQSSRLTSLPRALTVDDPQKRVNGDADVSRKSAVPSRYHQFMTSEDEAHSQTSSARSTEDEEEEEEEVKTAVKTVSPVKPEAPVGPAPPKETSQENCREMRISLNQKPNSSKDFGFQAVWDSTGARVTSIQPGSPAEMCQLQVGDEVLTLNGQQVADMSYVDWKSSMEEALQEGSLIIDIRHRGNNSSHDNNAVGSSLDFTSRRSTAAKPPPPPVREAAARPLLDAASNGVNGGFREPPVTLRNKESEPISLKNLKRRSEFFEKGGSESVMPDIPVPPLTLTSSRWSWDPEEERKRQEKWQKEQERILQEKYKRDQEKLQEEWLKDQEEIARSTDPPEPVSLEVNRHIISPHSPRSPLNQPPWEEEEEEEERKREEEEEERQRKVEEERQRQEEVERQRQAEVERQRQAEERSRREEEKRELQRLQEERQRKERQEEEERKMVAEEELRWQKRREEEREAERRRQEAAEQQRRDQWMKSKSCSQLDEEEAPQRKVTGGGGLAEKKGLQSGSHAELERQQILNEMKKKTPLLMDRSWIRQRSAATEPDAGGVKESDMPPIRRGESLDNLDSYNSWRSSWTPRTSSVSQVQNYTRPHSALSGAPRPGSSSTLPSSSSMGSLRGGAGTPSFPWSQQSSTSSLTDTSPEPTSEGPQQRGRSVSGKKICTFCDAALGKGAAMIIESLGLCYHLGCFKCIDCKSDLGGSQAGAEVRIRNKQLYCNSCYVRFKAGQPTSM